MALATRAGNATDCDIIFENTLAAINHTSCHALQNNIDSECVDFAFICQNVCWNRLIAEVSKANLSGCQADIAAIKSYCDPAMCETETANMLVRQWLGSGCPEMDTCNNPFARCTLEHSTECLTQHTCPSNCSGHGACLRDEVNGASYCKCHKG